jgi:hypothetical protein
MVLEETSDHTGSISSTPSSVLLNVARRPSSSVFLLVIQTPILHRVLKTMLLMIPALSMMFSEAFMLCSISMYLKSIPVDMLW